MYSTVTSSKRSAGGNARSSQKSIESNPKSRKIVDRTISSPQNTINSKEPFTGMQTGRRGSTIINGGQEIQVNSYLESMVSNRDSIKNILLTPSKRIVDEKQQI